MKKLHLASILIISQLINIDGDALSRDSVCVCVAPSSIYSELRGSFLNPVSISYSRCHSVCHILVCHTKESVEWAAGMNKQQA